MKAILLLLTVLAPFIHFGVNEYLSVSFLLFFIISLYLVIAYSKICAKSFFVLGLPLLLVSLFKAIFNPDIYPLLVNLREISVMIALLVLVSVAKKIEVEGFFLLKIISFLILGWALLQLSDIYFNIGGGLFFPSERFFNLNYGTLASNLYAKFGSVGRPSAGFSEPSSLGAFGLCIFFIGSEREKYNLSLLGALLVILSSSFSSILGLAGLIVIFSSSFPKRYLSILLLGIGIGAIYMAQRFLRISIGEDQSALQRLFFPFQILIKFGSFFGIDKEVATSRGAVLGADVNLFDNYFLGKLITDGFYIVVLAPLLFMLFKLRFFILFVAMGFINGSPFYYDRFVLFAIVIIYSYSAIHYRSSRINLICLQK